MTEEPVGPPTREEWEAYKQERNARLRRFFVKVVVIFAILGLSVSGTMWYVYTTSEDNQEALCAIRHDAERRVSLGETFLEENPEGIPGLSIDSLRRSVANAKETAKSLSSLNCEPIATPTPSP